MILTFLVPSSAKPVGGVIAIFELANALARRGHTVNLEHHSFLRQELHEPRDIEWFDFEPSVRHRFPDRYDPADLPPADIRFSYDPAAPASSGLPVVLIQGWGMLGFDLEAEAYRHPCPKVCVAGWLVDVGLGLGVPAEQLWHVPNGVRHDRYRLPRPIEGRGPVVAYCSNPHRMKRAEVGFAALELARERVPGMEAIIFGASARGPYVPAWARYRRDPAWPQLVQEVYGPSRIFLCSSVVEGFGLPSVEAMACGCALVTTDNGGSQDYAVPGETALVAPVDDAEALAHHLVHLLDDPGACEALAGRGRARAASFDWDRSAAALEGLCTRYLAEPRAFQRPPDPLVPGAVTVPLAHVADP